LAYAGHGCAATVPTELVATHLHGLDRCSWGCSTAGGAPWRCALKREVNDRCGRFKLRSGATLFVNEFYKDEAVLYESATVRGKMCF